MVANQRDWVKLIDIARFSYNLEELNDQQECNQNCEWVATEHRHPLATGVWLLLKWWCCIFDGIGMTKESIDCKFYLEWAVRKMKRWIDSERKHVSFNIGDKVLMKL